MKNRKFISLVIAFVFIFSFINCIKLDTNTFAKNINIYSCNYYESYEPTEVCENVRAIFSKYDIDNEDNLLMVGCNKDYILDFRLVGNAIGKEKE